MRVAFWGTPDFATPPLRALLGEGHDVVAVVTQPDRPRGRSRSQLDPSPVKVVATTEGVPVLQPDKPRGEEFMAQLAAFAPDISVVVAYGHILPKAVIDLPRLGTLNIHASLLPAYRGAAPIQAAILAGETETGVTIMRMVPALDAGPAILTLGTPIAPDETAGELTLRLSELGATALIEALALIELGAAVEAPQDDARATYAAKIDRTQAQLDWGRNAEEIARHIRAFDPKPGAWTTAPALGALEATPVRLYGAQVVSGGSGPAGAVLDAQGDGLVIACGTGAVRVAEVHPAGKKRTAAAQWLRGRGIEIGAVLA
jgi:methionyl-tRNA formyltransferase